MTEWVSWLREKNRPKHFAVGVIIGLCFGFLVSVVGGVSAEYKDWKYAGSKGGYLGWLKGGAFDYLDLAATALGGLIGGTIHFIYFGRL